MAKTLSAKSRLIREAVAAHPRKKPKEIAALINGSDARKLDKLEVTPNEVSVQKQALRGLGGAAKPKKPGPKAKAAPKAAETKEAATPASAAKSNGTVEVIDRVFDLAEQVGGFGQLKRLVDRLAGR